jgi:hypothetical protein
MRPYWLPGFTGWADINGGGGNMPDKDQETTVETNAIQKLNALVNQARAGDERVLPQLRQALDEHPQVWQHFGALSNHVQEEWIKLLAGEDLAVHESLLRKAQAMRVELEGESPSPLERLLCDSVVTSWLESEYFALVLVSSGNEGTPRQIESLHLRRDAAQKCHLVAIKSLAEVRRLLSSSPPRQSSASRATTRETSRSKTHTKPVRAAGKAPGRQTIPMKARRKR